jgi:subtilisin family serine protease
VFGDPLGHLEDIEIDWPNEPPTHFTDDLTLTEVVRQASGRVHIGFKEPGINKMVNRPTRSFANNSRKTVPAVTAATIKAARAYLESQGARITMPFRRLPGVVAEIDPEMAATIGAHPLIDYVEPVAIDRPWSIRPIPSFQEIIPNNIEAIRADDAHALGELGSGSIVTIMDHGSWDGFLSHHEDLPAYQPYWGCRTFEVPDPGQYCRDEQVGEYRGHGSNVAGIAVALRGNNRGVVGVAPNAIYRSLTVCTDEVGGCATDWETAALEEIRNNGFREIVNMSFGGAYRAQRETAASLAYQAGDLLVAAAGNDGVSQVDYPARASSVIAVSSLNTFNTARASHSQYGPQIEFAAPGYVELTTDVGAGDNNYSDDFVGTSAATPHVTGVAALIWAQNPNLTNVEVRNWLRYSVDDLSPTGRDNETGYGRTNAYKAVTTVPPLTISISGPNQVNLTPLSQDCTWTAVVTGGRPPYSYIWSGVLSGNQKDVTGQVLWSGNLNLQVTSDDNQVRNTSKSITVNPSAPDCN